jgi:hypothetical protein
MECSRKRASRDATETHRQTREITRRHVAGAALTLLVAAGCDSVSDFLSTDPIVYTIGGDVEGLAAGERVVLGLGDDRVTVTGNGSFAFEQRHESGYLYEVVIVEQPAARYCAVDNGAGTVGSVDVDNVRVDCRAVLRVSWGPSRHSSVNRGGGGYTLYFSREPGFHPDDPGVATREVLHDTSRSETPTTAVLPGLKPGTWYFRVQAFSDLGRSELSPESTFVLEDEEPP